MALMRRILRVESHRQAKYGFPTNKYMQKVLNREKDRDEGSMQIVSAPVTYRADVLFVKHSTAGNVRVFNVSSKHQVDLFAKPRADL